MANFIPANNYAGASITLAPGEYALISPGIVVAPNASTAISGVGGNNIVNQGSITADRGVSLGDGTTLYNGLDGQILAQALGVIGEPGTQTVHNLGSILSNGIGIYAFFATTLNIFNSGLITSDDVKFNLTSAALWCDHPTNVTLTNSGVMQSLVSGGWAVLDESTGVQSITNTGRMIGNVALGGGNDTLRTASGRISGLIDGGAGSDTVFGTAFADIVRGGTESDALTGNGGNDQLSGDAGNDTLNGGLGNDILNGGANNDRLFGGAGIDKLTGGLNADIFVFNTAPNAVTNRDIVVDFSHVDDNFWLENAVFTKLGAGVHALNPLFFRAGAAALDANDYVVYDRATGLLSYDANGNAAGGAIVVAQLANKPVLAANDFLVI